MKLSQLADFNVRNLTKKDVFETINYLDTSNITEGTIDTVVEYNLKEAPSRAKRKIKHNDIIYSTVRPKLKHYGIMKNCQENDIVSTGFTVISCHKDVNPDYIYTYLTLPFITDKLASIAEGAVSTYPSIRPKDLENIEIKRLNIEAENKIAKLFTMYNELIQNKKNQINLLEKSVEKIYEEWFIKYRLPECKNIELIELNPKEWIYGIENKMYIPKNWNYVPLSTIAKFVRGKNLTSENMIDGEIPVISAGLQPSGFHNKANVKGKSLTISASGANAGFLKYNLKDIWASDCSYYKNDNNIWFVYSTLNFLRKVLTNLQIGSAQPHVYPKNINNLKIIVPEEKYILLFEKTVNAFFENISILEDEIEIINKQKNLLLPRLMSGSIEI